MDSGHDHHAMHQGHGDHGDHGVMATVTQNIVDILSKPPPMMDHSHHTMDHGSSEGHSMGHSMTFHGGYNETVLFSWWKFESIGGLFGSIFIIFLVAVCYEGLKYYREYLFWSTNNSLQYRVVQPPDDNKAETSDNRVVHMVSDVLRKQPPSMFSKIHLWQTFLHAIQVTVSYLLMLIFMTYNTWLCVAVVAGACFGNFLFGWKKSIIVDVTEHCH